jgi:hypothetical protein
MEAATDDLEWVTSVRNARIIATDRVRNSNEKLSVVLRECRNDPLARWTYLVALTDVHSCLGKVEGRRLIASLSLQPLIRVSELSEDNINDLSKCCG